MAPAIGIDLGTTYSCVAVLYKGNIEIISNDLGKRTTPSYVSFSDKERLVGTPAKRKGAMNPKNTIYDVKRLIGRRFDDPMILEDMKHWPFGVIDVEGKPMIQAKFKGVYKTFAPEEISSMILTKMKQTAEKFLGTEVKDAVITVPAYFNDSQREATKDAGTIAGLKVLRIINEPTAAALAYGLQKDLKGERNVLIYDLGGGTFDVTVLTITEGSVFKVKSTSGDTHLGGEDFDRCIVKFLIEKLKDDHQKNIKCDHKTTSRLKTAAEVAKLELSSSIVSSIDLEALYDSKDFSTEFSQVCFNELCIDLFKKTLGPVKQALADAKMDKDSIDDIVLVGGSTRIPKVQELLQEFFSGKELTLSINPDEAVAYGAAVEAAILSGDSSSLVKDILLVDVTPLSLGIDIKGGLMSKVVERNTQIPCTKTKNFTTVEDNQNSINFQVFEGERSLTVDNNFLGKFVLYDIPPGPAGTASVDVTFDLDANSILKVSAVEKTTGSSEKVIIREGKSNLSSADINRMRCEAERFKAEDEQEFARITERNRLEAYINKARNALSKSDNNVQQRDRNKGRELCDEAFKWLQANPKAAKEAYENQNRVLSFQIGKIIAIV